MTPTSPGEAGQGRFRRAARIWSRLPVCRPELGLALLGLSTFAIGYLGQDSWQTGAAYPQSAVSAIVTDVVGGPGSRQPVRIVVSLAVTNAGLDEVRVYGPGPGARSGPGTEVLSVSTPELAVGGGRTGRLDADVTLDCRLPGSLRLPDLRVELPDGVRERLRIGGDGRLLEACARATAAVRPVNLTVRPPAEDDESLTVRVTSPTGRHGALTAIRAGGVDLLAGAGPVTVTGPTPVDVPLTAPDACPAQWAAGGIPSAVTIDLAPGPGADSAATLSVRLGPALTSWLLATSCRGPG